VPKAKISLSKAYFQRVKGCTANSTKIKKKLEVYKGGTFAPATTNKFLTSWQANERKAETKVFKKLSKKH
jgi:hypothetical protein